MIYVPDLDNYECFVVQNDTTIRAYEDIPRANTTVKYRDYFITANYIYKDGQPIHCLLPHWFYWCLLHHVSYLLLNITETT